MAVKWEIEIEIQPDGSVRMETHGIKGAGCDAELKPIEAALGEVKQAAKTREYYEQSVTGQATAAAKQYRHRP